ncbi:MAG: ERCC4 domain-containing protein [Elusimicrobiota bacterium]
MEVLVDSREQYPLLFPSALRLWPDRSVENKLVPVKVRVTALKYGDYCLARWPDRMVVERKGSLNELAKNLLTDDYGRFISALRRLCENCRFPYILLDASPTELWTPTQHCDDPQRAWDALAQVMQMFQVGLLWAGQAKKAGARRILGEQLLRLMLAYGLREDDDAKFPRLPNPHLSEGDLAVGQEGLRQIDPRQQHLPCPRCRGNHPCLLAEAVS